MTGDEARDTIEKLLGTDTTFREERRAHKPQLCPALAQGTGEVIFDDGLLDVTMITAESKLHAVSE